MQNSIAIAQFQLQQMEAIEKLYAQLERQPMQTSREKRDSDFTDNQMHLQIHTYTIVQFLNRILK